MPDRPIEHWQQAWQRGERYDLSWKQNEVMPVLEQLESKGQLGTVVADIGSGPLGVSRLLYGKDLKLIRVDIAAKDVHDDKVVQAQMDVDKLPSADTQTKRSLVKIREWLKEQGIDTSNGPVVDTMIISELVNYIDYEETIPALLQYVKEGGRVVVFNMPERGYKQHFIDEDKRPTGNYRVVYFFGKTGFSS